MASEGYQLPALPYDYNALEPFIGARIMQLHHSGHHQTYVTKLNAALKGTDDIQKPIHELQYDAISLGGPARNNGGGHYNHSLFWTLMAKPGSSNPAPHGQLKLKIEDEFQSVDGFKKQFNDACADVFGSGWVWLGVTQDGKLSIETTMNQDNPLMKGAPLSKNSASKSQVVGTGGVPIIPILGQDVWEHAYYLSYENRKVEYFNAWWNVVNWDKVVEYYDQFASKQTPVPAGALFKQSNI
nr:cytosolic Mn-superoxide dismutase-2 [Spirogyra sp. KG0101]